MKYGFFKVAAVSPKLRVADVKYNTEKIIEAIDDAVRQHVELLVFPEKCITGATVGDLCGQRILENGIKTALTEIEKSTVGRDIIVVLSFPSCEKRGAAEFVGIENGRTVAVGNGRRGMLIESERIPGLSVAVCTAAMLNRIPSKASIVACVDAKPELAGRAELKETVIKAESIRQRSAVIYANAGSGESSTDFVYGGRKLIYEAGRLLAKSGAFGDEMIITDIDLERLCVRIDISGTDDFKLSRRIPQNPFLPSDASKKRERLAEILEIQAHGLLRRMEHIGCKTAVIGISGGLDSTLALLVTRRAYELAGLGTDGIVAVTMPAFGTSGRTYENALEIMKQTGVTAREINIKEAVLQHLSDIGHNPENKNAAYENAQARERTQVLMDIANDVNGIVVGTGDLSELALGFATYNGDHMSMYGVNASVPKTLVRELVGFVAESEKNEKLKNALLSVCDTPISPELLPTREDGSIAQCTEDIVGPYELHDFFIYHIIKYGFSPSKILFTAVNAFEGKYDETTVKHWLSVFLKRFFSQQFKRSCLPDGVAVGSIGLSPREGFKMPSDAVAKLWLEDIE